VSPLRLLVLAALGYIFYLLLFCRSPKSPPSSTVQDDVSQTAVDVLVEDPVCHTYIPQQGAESVSLRGVTYYFCSLECRNKFQSEKRS